MGRFKIKKADLFIDMTPMSDVMLLLLTFFLMAGTFTKPEPVQVNAPQSVSDIKIPDQDILTIYVKASDNKASGNDTLVMADIYINIDNGPVAQELAKVIKTLPLCNTFKKAEIDEFKEKQSIKVAIGQMVANRDNQADATTPSQFKEIIKKVREIYNNINKTSKEKNPDAPERNLRIAIKADKGTPYSTVKVVMNSLQDIQENRYNLLTELKARPTD